MEQKKLTALTDQELLREVKKMKTAAIIDAALIGFLAGVVVYSVVKHSLGFLTLIPLYLVYKLVDKPKYKSKEVEALLKERGLK